MKRTWWTRRCIVVTRATWLCNAKHCGKTANRIQSKNAVETWIKWQNFELFDSKFNTVTESFFELQNTSHGKQRKLASFLKEWTKAANVNAIFWPSCLKCLVLFKHVSHKTNVVHLRDLPRINSFFIRFFIYLL